MKECGLLPADALALQSRQRTSDSGDPKPSHDKVILASGRPGNNGRLLCNFRLTRRG
jgi:hypothetical protein